MKTKLLIIVAACAVITLSFTFTGNNKVEEKATVQQVSNDNEPAGGFASEDKF
jgi:hypothetical protein